MKKMLHTALALLYRMCSTDVYCSKQTGNSSTEPSPIISSFLELGEENCRCSQNFGRRREMLLKQKPAIIRKWIARFYYFRHLYSAGSACIATVRELPSDMGQLYLHYG